MFSQKSLGELTAKLRQIEAEIAEHPMAAEEFERAGTLTESLKAQGVSDPKVINMRRAEQGLPSLEETGRIIATHMLSWGKLHRKKKKISTQIEKLSSS